MDLDFTYNSFINVCLIKYKSSALYESAYIMIKLFSPRPFEIYIYTYSWWLLLFLCGSSIEICIKKSIQIKYKLQPIYKTLESVCSTPAGSQKNRPNVVTILEIHSTLMDTGPKPMLGQWRFDAPANKRISVLKSLYSYSPPEILINSSYY